MSLRDETFVFLGEDKETTERKVFEAFIEIHPNFAEQPIGSWDRGANPPDFRCYGLSGSRIGIELTEWVNTDQIASVKAKQDLELSFLEMIGSETVLPPKNIESVTLRVTARHLPRFLSENNSGLNYTGTSKRLTLSGQMAKLPMASNQPL